MDTGLRRCDETGRSVITAAKFFGAVFGLIAAAVALKAGPAAAHGFGQRYDLPLPLSLYLLGIGAAVVVSFLIVGLFVRGGHHSESYHRLDLVRLGIGRIILHPVIGLVLKLLALAVFAVTLMAAFIGDQNPYRNLAPTMVWVIFWVGLAYVSAFVGDIWALINPLGTIFDGTARLLRRVLGRHALRFRLHYPERAGVWPACLLLLLFSWIELVYPTPAEPRHIAWFATIYALLTWAGMALFGAKTWLQRGEVFTLVFGTFARFAPIEARPRDFVCALRPFGAGLLGGGPVSMSMTAFVLLLLSTVLYDGLLGTPEWVATENAVVALSGGSESTAIAVRTIGLIGFWLVFFGVFIAVAAVMNRIAGGAGSARHLARELALTLVPVAIGYHLAHYLLLLLIQGQYLVPLISDPFGFGWNLFGTAGYRVDIAVLGARFAWYTAVTAILFGHIAAVALAHARAMRVLPDRSAALRAEVPLTALMVCYTSLSLSILAEPIVEHRASAAAETAALVVPADALIPEPGTGRLIPVGPGKEARNKLTYRLLASDFHDGTRMSAADLLYAYMFAWRWSTPDEAEPASYDPAIAAATAPLRQALMGFRLIGTDAAAKSFRVGDFNVTRELFIVDVYLAIPSEDPEQAAAVAPPWSTLPWHVLVLMEEAVDRGWAAFSAAEAQRRGVEWLDLVRSPEMNAQLLKMVEEFAAAGYRPEALETFVTADEARSRWTALAEFFRERGHFLVTNGPYRLKSWSAEGVVLEAFRDLSYPLGVGSFDAYAIPRRGYVTGISRAGDRLTLFASIETVTKFGRSYRLDLVPMRAVSSELLKRAAPECRYVIVDAGGQAVLAGTARPGEEANLDIDTDGKLADGRYTLMAEIVVNANAMNAEIRRFEFTIP